MCRSKMKNIVGTFIACLALTVGMSGCYDDIDDKVVIDAKHEQSCEVTVSLGETSVVSFSEIAVGGAVSSLEGVLEVGFMLSATDDFSKYDSYPVKELATSFSMPISSLSETTTYYVRSYAYTIAGTKVSETKSLTTTASPVFDLNGVYSAVDYDAEENTGGDSYEVTVEFVDGSETELSIANLWDGGMTINATYDPATGKISIPAKQIIYVHPSYGDVWMEDGNGKDVIEGNFTAKGGFLNINTFSAICGAGSFGAQYVKMNHK